ncbi:hypothetical protein V5O48_016245 [Marasmius crinis-equi]|uniref:Uncharacterized protein n=1 Tax=Marasmius crinis-equi TaxID=585013 RepID=A0ABR3ES97_9AGAR
MADTQPMSNVVLPSLRKLAIFDDHGQYSGRNVVLLTLLTSLVMPALVSFEMTSQDWPIGNSLLAMLQRSPSLESVVLEFYRGVNGQGGDRETPDMSRYPLLPLLDNLPHLTHFELSLPSYSAHEPETRQRFLHSLIVRLLSRLRSEGAEVAAPAFLPHIQTLHMKLSDFSLDTKMMEQVTAVVSSRYCLREFRIVPANEMSETSSSSEGVVLERVEEPEEHELKASLADI